MRVFRTGGRAAAIALAILMFWALALPRTAAAAGAVSAAQAGPEPAPVVEPAVAPEPATGEAARERMSYLGVLRGTVMPNTMHERWSYAATGQSADLLEEMQRGSLSGGQTGFLPAQFDRFVALEVEQSKQQADVRTIMSPGLEVGKQEISGFYTDAEDSRVLFQPTMFNLLLRYPDGRVNPYLGIGGGISRSTVSFNEETVTNEGFGFAEAGETTSLAFQVLLGVDYQVSPRLALGIGYRYFSVQPVFEWANGSQSRYEIATHSVAFTTKTYR